MTSTTRTPRRSSIEDILELYKKDVDRTLLREQLRKTPDERVRELVEFERFAEALRDAARRATRLPGPSTSPLS
jgi:hypothetical protein